MTVQFVLMSFLKITNQTNKQIQLRDKNLFRSFPMNKSQYRNTSTIPTVSAFNNWFSQHQKKPTMSSYQAKRMTPTKYSSTIAINPQSSQYQDNKPSQFRMRRTHSAFRNNQSRVSTMKDDAFELRQQIKYLAQKTKSSRLGLEMTKKGLVSQLKEREKSMMQDLCNLNKLVKQTMKMDQMRTEQIKNDSIQVRASYNALKQTIHQLDSRLSAVEHQCGFMTFASKLYK